MFKNFFGSGTDTQKLQTFFGHKNRRPQNVSVPIRTEITKIWRLQFQVVIKLTKKCWNVFTNQLHRISDTASLQELRLPLPLAYRAHFANRVRRRLRSSGGKASRLSIHMLCLLGFKTCTSTSCLAQLFTQHMSFDSLAVSSLFIIYYYYCYYYYYYYYHYYYYYYSVLLLLLLFVVLLIIIIIILS